MIAVEVVRSGQILDQDCDMELYNTERWREVEEPAIAGEESKVRVFLFVCFLN